MLAPSTRPSDGLIVYSEALVLGVTRDPSVSVPTAIGAKPALTAMADPDEDPSGLWTQIRCCHSLPRIYLRYGLHSHHSSPGLHEHTQTALGRLPLTMRSEFFYLCTDQLGQHFITDSIATYL